MGDRRRLAGELGEGGEASGWARQTASSEVADDDDYCWKAWWESSACDDEGVPSCGDRREEQAEVKLGRGRGELASAGQSSIERVCGGR